MFFKRDTEKSHEIRKRKLNIFMSVLTLCIVRLTVKYLNKNRVCLFADNFTPLLNSKSQYIKS